MSARRPVIVSSLPITSQTLAVSPPPMLYVSPTGADSAATGFADVQGKKLAMARSTRMHQRLYLDRACREAGHCGPERFFGQFVRPATAEDGLAALGKLTRAVVLRDLSYEHGGQAGDLRQQGGDRDTAQLKARHDFDTRRYKRHERINHGAQDNRIGLEQVLIEVLRRPAA